MLVDIAICDLINSIQSHLNDNRKGERLRNGIQVVIIGQPNAGKSSLLNKICNRPAAIVSPIPGTTRDVIESAVNIDGYPIVISDTAGLRKSSDLVEIEGVKRALQKFVVYHRKLVKFGENFLIFSLVLIAVRQINVKKYSIIRDCYYSEY